MTSRAPARRHARLRLPVPPAALAPIALAACTTLAAPPTAAQAVADSTAQAAADRATARPPSTTIVVTGNPLGREDTLQPVTVLDGEALALRRAGTLGDTLAGLPGVASSGFGPQSARPVIRGLDGDRIRLLDNGGAAVDASSLSFDHAVALDPLVVERIEVLRGPAALLYGGNATGGVVNLLDNRVPRFALERLGGRAELRLGGAAQERAAAAVLEGGQGGLSWHADAAERRSRDLRVPRFTPPGEEGADAATDRVANSAGLRRSGALGASWADAQGFVGAAVDSHRNDYGVAVAPDVTIRLQREHLQLAGERRGLTGPFSELSWRIGRTRYGHEEIEAGGEVGTTFRSRGQELRLQARHAPLATPLGPLHGVLGLQHEALDFNALGEEAFVPDTRSRSSAVFVLEELRLAGGALLGAGLRLERSRVASAGDPAVHDDDDHAAHEGHAEDEGARFGPAQQRRFSPASLSLSAQWPLGSGWRLAATLGRTERAPAYYELFAHGAHVATGAYERGDPTLGTERSRQLELALHWQQGPAQWRLNAFASRFARYIALMATGQTVTHAGHDGETASLPEYAFRGVPARLHGLELEGRWRLAERPWTLDASASLDLVRGHDQASGEPLPRLPPLRATLALQAGQGAWRGGLQLSHAAAQRRVPATDVPTPGHTLLGLWAAWQQRWGGHDAVWTLKLDNLGDRLAYNASALRSARALAPQGGRALGLGLRLDF